MAPEDAAAGLVGVFFIPLLSSSRVVFFSRWALWGLASRTRFAKNPFFLARGARVGQSRQRPHERISAYRYFLHCL